MVPCQCQMDRWWNLGETWRKVWRRLTTTTILAGNVANMSATCRHDSQMLALGPTRPCRADTKLIQTQHFRVGDGRQLPLSSLSTRGRYNTCTTCQKSQDTTTNMSHANLPSTGLKPLPPWVGQRHHQIMVPPLPIGLRKASAVRLCRAAVGSLVWGTNASLINK